jgi:WD40 repeat protein
VEWLCGPDDDYPVSVAWSPDGLTIAYGTTDSRKIKTVPVGPEPATWDIHPTGDVTWLAGSGANGDVTYTDGAAGTASFASPRALDWSPDGGTIAVADYNTASARIRGVAVSTGAVSTIFSATEIYNPETGTNLGLERAYGVSYSPDGSTLAVATRYAILTLL